MNQCGRATFRSSTSVSMLRANAVLVPETMAVRTVRRANTCASGRNSSSTSPGPQSAHCCTDWQVNVMLSWVIIAPFGMPVVPEV